MYFTNTENKSNKPKKSKSILFIVIALLLVTIGVAWLKKDYLIFFATLTMNDPYKPGDRMYVRPSLVDSTSKGYNVNLWMDITPLDDNDALKAPCLYQSDWQISTDSLVKYKTAFLGTYVKSSIENLYLDEHKPLPYIFTAFKPNNKALVYDVDKRNPLPAGYKLAKNGLFYVMFGESQTTETTTFRK